MQKNYLKLVIFTYIFFSASNPLFSQPKNTDYVLGYGGLAILTVSELFFKETFSPQQPKWVKPNSFDLFFRENLKWDNQNINKAAFASDVLLKGIILPSVFWSPLLTDYNYGRYLLLNAQVIAATGIITNITKFALGRERPYSYYSTVEPKGADDFLSFFSGHSSLSFAVATSTAHLLERENPNNSALIWGSAIMLASITGYLRIASDRHYMSDVLTGTIIGSLAGYLIAREQHGWFFKKKKSNQKILLTFSLPL